MMSRALIEKQAASRQERQSGGAGLQNAACTGVIAGSHQLHAAEIGLTVDRGVNVRAHPLYPSYCMVVRLLELSIDDYLGAEDEQTRQSEIEFWRESRMFLFFGQMVCEMERVLHGRPMHLDELRRGAEVKMGLPAGALAPERPLTLQEE